MKKYWLVHIHSSNIGPTQYKKEQQNGELSEQN